MPDDKNCSIQVRRKLLNDPAQRLQAAGGDPYDNVSRLGKNVLLYLGRKILTSAPLTIKSRNAVFDPGAARLQAFSFASMTFCSVRAS